MTIIGCMAWFTSISVAVCCSQDAIWMFSFKCWLSCLAAGGHKWLLLLLLLLWYLGLGCRGMLICSSRVLKRSCVHVCGCNSFFLSCFGCPGLTSPAWLCNHSRDSVMFWSWSSLLHECASIMPM